MDYQGFDDTEKVNGGTWIMTYSGNKVDLFQPCLDTITLDDLIYPASRICRSNGHTKFFYSILQHMINATLLADDIGSDKRIMLLLLVHDLHESMTGDVNSVQKQFIKEQYKPFEDRFEKLVYEYLHIPFPTKEEQEIVKMYDTLAFKCECRVLFKDDSFINSEDEELNTNYVLKLDSETVRDMYRDLLFKLLYVNGIEYKE